MNCNSCRENRYYHRWQCRGWIWGCQIFFEDETWKVDIELRKYEEGRRGCWRCGSSFSSIRGVTYSSIHTRSYSKRYLDWRGTHRMGSWSKLISSEKIFGQIWGWRRWRPSSLISKATIAAKRFERPKWLENNVNLFNILPEYFLIVLLVQKWMICPVYFSYSSYQLLRWKHLFLIQPLDVSS